MYQVQAMLERARLLELQRQRGKLFHPWRPQASPALSQGLRHSAGNALIALGTWIKPRNGYSPRQPRLVGR